LDCLGSHRNLDNYNYVKARLAETPEELLKPAPFLSGHDLIAMGLQPGPLFKEILSAVEDAQLDGKLGSREQALNWVRSRYPQPPDKPPPLSPT
jgi:poly(A) polymerase